MSIFGPDNDDGDMFDDDEDGLDETPAAAPSAPALPAVVKRKIRLVAQFDENSAPLVARADAKTNELLEEWRKPSRREVQALQQAGKLVHGGFVENDPPALTQTQLAAAGSGVSINWKKLGLVFGGIAAVGTAGFVGYRYWKAGRDDGEED